MTITEKLTTLSKDLGALHGWEGGAGLIEIWVDGNGPQKISIEYAVSTSENNKEFHIFERTYEASMTLEEMVDIFDMQCRDGL